MNTVYRTKMGQVAYEAYGAWPTPISGYPSWHVIGAILQERWNCAAQDVCVAASENRPWNAPPAWLNQTPDTVTRWGAAASAVENETPDMGAPARGIT